MLSVGTPLLGRDPPNGNSPTNPYHYSRSGRGKEAGPERAGPQIAARVDERGTTGAT